MRAKEQRERVREVELQSENTRRLKRNQNNMNSEKNLLGSFSRKSTDLKDLIHADLSDSMTTSTTRDTDSITSNSADRRQEPESYHIEPSPFIKNESQIVDGLDLATAMNGGGADSAPRPVSSPSRPKFSSEFMSQSSHPLLPKASYVQLETFEPFGLPSIVEIIKVSTSLMNPRNRQYVDNVHRRLGLTLMITAMEVGGQSLNKWIDWGIAVEEKKRESYHDRRTSLIPTNLEGAVDMIAKGREKSARKDVHVEIPQVNEQDFALPKPQHLQQQQQQDETDLASLNGGVGGTMTSTNSTVVNDDGTSSINNLSDEKQLLLNGDTHPEHTGSPSSATSETIHVNGDSRKEKSPTDINAVESVKSPQQQQEQPAEALTDSMFQSQEDSHEERMAIKAKEYITNEMCKHLFQVSHTNRCDLTWWLS